MGKNEDVQAALDQVNADFDTMAAAVAAFIQSLKDQIAAAPAPGGLTPEQADAVISQANALDAKVKSIATS